MPQSKESTAAEARGASSILEEALPNPKLILYRREMPNTLSHSTPAPSQHAWEVPAQARKETEAQTGKKK